MTEQEVLTRASDAVDRLAREELFSDNLAVRVTQMAAATLAARYALRDAFNLKAPE